MSGTVENRSAYFFNHWVTVIALSFVVLEYILCRALESAVLQGHCYWSWGTGKSHANGPNRKSVEMRLLPRHWVTVTVLSFVGTGEKMLCKVTVTAFHATFSFQHNIAQYHHINESALLHLLVWVFSRH